MATPRAKHTSRPERHLYDALAKLRECPERGTIELTDDYTVISLDNKTFMMSRRAYDAYKSIDHNINICIKVIHSIPDEPMVY